MRKKKRKTISTKKPKWQSWEFLEKLSHHPDFSPLEIFPNQNHRIKIEFMDPKTLANYEKRIVKKINLMEKIIFILTEEINERIKKGEQNWLPPPQFQSTIKFAREVIKLTQEIILKQIEKRKERKMGYYP